MLKGFEKLEISVKKQFANFEKMITPTLERHTKELASHETRLQDVECAIANLAEQDVDEESGILKLVALEEALLANPIYASTIVLSNWGGLEKQAREKRIRDTLNTMNKKSRKVEHVSTLVKVSFEMPETAVAFKSAWIKSPQVNKNDQNKPIFATRDAPKVVRELRRMLVDVERTLKKATWSMDKSKHVWRVNWARGGILSRDATDIACRRPNGHIKWLDEAAKELYMKNATSAPANGAANVSR